MGLNIVLAIIAFVALYGVAVYNKLVKFRTLVDEAWSGINVQLKKRHDLIPNLMETVRGYAAHEKETFESVTLARNTAIQAQSVKTQEVAENQLSGALSRLLAVSERYPELKANENFIRLQDEISGTENRISVARKRYNDAVQSFNASIKRIPGRFFGYIAKDYFNPPAGTKINETPVVNFN